jgi:exosortase family protein XrtF
MSNISIQEFKPTIYFLLKFLGIYLVGNLLYGWFVATYSPAPDPITHMVSAHAAGVLRAVGFDISLHDYTTEPTCGLLYQGKSILGVYEGCNGLNTVIIFVAFIVAFGPLNARAAWFIPLGLFIIHLTNLARITLLFLVAVYRPQSMYFVHKYLFTAILYAVIFILWMWWIMKFSKRMSSDDGK